MSLQEKLIDGFLKDLNVSGDEFLSAYDEINPKSKNLVRRGVRQPMRSTT